MSKTILAWHFGGAKLGFDDGRHMRLGVRQRFRPANGHDSLVMCECGMHGSRDIMDALKYARGTTIRRVELSGELLDEHDKCCAEYRRALWAAEGEELLRRFARLCALDVIHAWNPSEVVLKWLRTGDEVVRSAARSAAASAAASAVADSAARAAARSAASAAADWAASAAAYSASSAAAYSASSAAAYSAQKHRLLAMVCAAKRKQEAKR